MKKGMQMLRENKNKVLLILISAVMLAFVWIAEDPLMEHSAASTDAEEVLQGYEGEEIDQTIDPGNKYFESIDVRYQKEPQERQLTIEVYEDDTLLQRFDGSRGHDYDNNGFITYRLAQTVKTKDDSRYHVTVKILDSNVQLLGNTDGELSVRTGWHGKGAYRRFIYFAVIIAVTAALILSGKNERYAMSFALLVSAVLVCRFMPVGIVPDEERQFFRAYGISQGDWICKVNEYGVGGDYFPLHIDQSSVYSAELDDSTLQWVQFPNTALYSPVPYLPQALAIKLATLFTSRPYYLSIAARLGGALFSMILCIAALWLIPYGAKVLFVIMMIPVTLQELCSVSADSMTLSLAFFLFAFILRCREQNRVRSRDIAIILIATVALSLCKIVYVVCAALVFLLPKESFSNRRAKLFTWAGIPVLCLVLNAIWLVIARRYLMEFTPGVDTPAQIQFVLTHIPTFFLITVRTFLNNAQDYVLQTFGFLMGSFNITNSELVGVMYVILLFTVAAGEREASKSPSARENTILMLLFLLCTALICCSLYVQWTALKNDMIEGIQGRYFLPVLAYPIFAAMNIRREKDLQAGVTVFRKTESSYIIIIALALNLISSVTLMMAS